MQGAVSRIDADSSPIFERKAQLYELLIERSLFNQVDTLMPVFDRSPVIRAVSDVGFPWTSLSLISKGRLVRVSFDLFTTKIILLA